MRKIAFRNCCHVGTISILFTLSGCSDPQVDPGGPVETNSGAAVTVKGGPSSRDVSIEIQCGEIHQVQVVSTADRGSKGMVGDAYFPSLPAPATCTATVTVLTPEGQPDPACSMDVATFSTTPGSIALVNTFVLCKVVVDGGVNVANVVRTANGLDNPRFPEGKWGPICGRFRLDFPVILNNADAYALTLAPVAPGAKVSISKLGDTSFQVQCLADGPQPTGAIELVATMEQYGTIVATNHFPIHCYDKQTGPQIGSACSNGLLGACAATGQWSCDPSADIPICLTAGAQEPAPEICNGIDDSCDGVVDEGNPGGGAACDTGVPGVCASGTTVCQAGTIVCQANQSPGPEVCWNGLDDNCSGSVDEHQSFECHSYAGTDAIPNCNSHPRCAADDTSCINDCKKTNTGKCSADLLDAWCRRVPGDLSGRWYALHRDWVAAHCPHGEVVFVPGANSDQDDFFCRQPEVCASFSCRTPLGLQFRSEEIAFTPARPNARFDLAGTGYAASYDVANVWWLGFPRGRSGLIESGRDLFGSGTPGGYKDGFAALRSLDANSDNQLDEKDPLFSKLVLWRDNGDWVCEASEIRSLADMKVTSLSLAYEVRTEYIGDNFVRERAWFQYLDENGVTKSGPLVDLHLRER